MFDTMQRRITINVVPFTYKTLMGNQRRTTAGFRDRKTHKAFRRHRIRSDIADTKVNVCQGPFNLHRKTRPSVTTGCLIFLLSLTDQQNLRLYTFLHAPQVLLSYQKLND